MFRALIEYLLELGDVLAEGQLREELPSLPSVEEVGVLDNLRELQVANENQVFFSAAFFEKLQQVFLLKLDVLSKL